MKLRFNVTGMTCAACSARVEKVTADISGVEKVEVNLLKGSMTVEAASDAVVAPIVDAVKKAGYGAEISGGKKSENPEKEDPAVSMKLRIILSFCFLAVLMYFTMGHMIHLPVPHWYHGRENAVVAALLQLFLTLPVVYLNRIYYSRGLKALWHRSPNMDTLVALGSSAAFVYSTYVLFAMTDAQVRGDEVAVMRCMHEFYFESAAMILTLITFGKFLEARSNK